MSSTIMTPVLRISLLAVGLAAASLSAGEKTADVNVVNEVGVNVTNSVLPVEVTNEDPLLVETVISHDNPALMAFAASGSSGFSGGSAESSLLTVPAGARAVIEHVSCIDFLDSANNFVRMELVYTLNGSTRKHQFVHTPVGASLVAGVDVWSFSQPIRVYADPDTTVNVAALRRLSAGAGGIECHINGHFVDLP